MNARRTKAKNKHECSRSGLLLPSEMTFRSFSQSVVKRKLKISKADVKGLLAELLIFRIRFSILQTLQICKLTTRPETGNPVGTHIAFYPSTFGSPPTPSGAPPRSRQSVKGRRISSSSGLGDAAPEPSPPASRKHQIKLKLVCGQILLA